MVANELTIAQVYTYSTNVKNQLLKIDTFDGNNTILNIKTFTDPTNDSFRPSSYDENNLTWQGRKLTLFGTNTYEYNSEEIRISKIVGNLKTIYVLDGKKIIKETKPNSDPVYYHYDENGEPVGFNYKGNKLFYIRDITGNIIKIVDINGIIQVTYEYDAWKKVLDTNGDFELIAANSFLYKGYYYDTETKLYYYNSRYYYPSVRRWISADDSYYLESDSLAGINLWSYCENNPVSHKDKTSCSWSSFWGGIGDWFTNVGEKIADTAEDVWEWTKETATNVSEWIKETVIKPVENFVTQTIPNVVNRLHESVLKPTGKWVSNFVTQIIPNFFTNKVWNEWIVGGF